MTKNKEETLTKTEEKTEEQPTEETKQVTPVAKVAPEAPAAKEPLKPVIISDMPTKKVVAPVNFAENDKKVFTWYSTRSAGEKYTRQQAADQLEISVEEFNNSIGRLQKSLLGENLGHLVDE